MHGLGCQRWRTNESFQNKVFKEHYEESIVENLRYFDVIKDVPLDPMQLFDLGIMRRFLSFLFGTRKGRNIRDTTLPKI